MFLKLADGPRRATVGAQTPFENLRRYNQNVNMQECCSTCEFHVSFDVFWMRKCPLTVWFTTCGLKCLPAVYKHWVYNNFQADSTAAAASLFRWPSHSSAMSDTTRLVACGTVVEILPCGRMIPKNVSLYLWHDDSVIIPTNTRNISALTCILPEIIWINLSTIPNKSLDDWKLGHQRCLKLWGQVAEIL